MRPRKLVTLTPAERQAKRQLKLKAAYNECLILRQNCNSATLIINTALESIHKISMKSEFKQSLDVAFNQIQGALRLINESTQERRLTD